MNKKEWDELGASLRVTVRDLGEQGRERERILLTKARQVDGEKTEHLIDAGADWRLLLRGLTHGQV